VTAPAVSIPVRGESAARLIGFSVGAAGFLIAIRVSLWVGVQLLLAVGIVVGGLAGDLEEGVNAAAGWWMVYGSLIDLATIAALVWLLRRHGIAYRQLLGPRAAVWQIGLGALAVLVVSAPAIFFSAELTAIMFGTDTPPMLAVVDTPAWAAAFSVLVWPLLAELAEPVAYFGIILPALERRLGHAWLAAAVMVGIWAAEHAFFPILITGEGLDLTFAAYRVLSVLPFLAIWTALYYAFGRRLLPLMAARWLFNGGTALAVPLGFM
jgi:hypothetical protein